ncbi:hypothetical protein EVAR_35463_1 [Eumeta japonica]|uniref:Uncharacterized protein n=1 Tax=Eumeta variegata TaxID=151549 RepID=A0A4C1XMB2_EUMVA|nr:hypothetical protein EVAR_35463_1 [Eumeta japonica]
MSSRQRRSRSTDNRTRMIALACAGAQRAGPHRASHPRNHNTFRPFTLVNAVWGSLTTLTLSIDNERHHHVITGVTTNVVTTVGTYRTVTKRGAGSNAVDYELSLRGLLPRRKLHIDWVVVALEARIYLTNIYAFCCAVNCLLRYWQQIQSTHLTLCSRMETESATALVDRIPLR